MTLTLFHKNRLIKFLTVVLAAVFFVAAGSGVSHAAVGDRGTDQSVYQGQYGRTAYGDEKFQIDQLGGTVNGWSTYTQWTYPYQVQNGIARGQHVHTYIWWQNVTTNAQADSVLNQLLPRVKTPRGSIVALDVESGYQNTWAIQHACDRIRQAGYTPMVYGYKNYLLNNTNLYYLSQHEQLWLAEYPDYAVRRYPNYHFFPSFNNVGVFQFTSTYIYGGLDGDVDLTGITDSGYTKNTNPAVTQPAQHPAPAQKQQPQAAANTYTVKYGDSWWAIANRYGMSMYQLASINGKSINSVIYPGQVLRIRANQQTAQQSSNSGSTWRDGLGDTWHKENGTFTANTWLNLRWGARTSSSRIALLAPGQTVKYDAWSNHGGYIWVRQPRSNGYGYVVVRNAVTHQAYGSFK